MDYLRFRRGKWEARVSIPKELRSHFGKTELCERIDADRKVAKRRAPLIVDKFNRELDAARAFIADGRPNVRELARLHYEHEVETDMNERIIHDPAMTDEMKSFFMKPASRPNAARRVRPDRGRRG